jgi:DNA polymerase-3 subunit gamma/tau
MALIRLAYAAELPPTDKLVKDLLDNPPPDGGSKAASRVGTAAPSGRGPATASVLRASAPQAQPEGAPTAAIRNLEDIVALAAKHSAPILRVALEKYVHLVSLEPGRIEFRPHAAAPRTLAGDLQQKLKDWTGERWSVSISNQQGAPTLSEQKLAAKTARFEAVAQEPMVRAVLDRFPGAEIVAVRQTASEDVAAPMPDKDEE